MNRELVERATHAKALQAITTELGDSGKKHATNTAGGYIADVQTAHSHIVNRDISFLTDNGDVCFPSTDECIRTRLAGCGRIGFG